MGKLNGQKMFVEMFVRTLWDGVVPVKGFKQNQPTLLYDIKLVAVSNLCVKKSVTLPNLYVNKSVTLSSSQC